MSNRLDRAESALREAMGPRLLGLGPVPVRNAARQILEAADSADSPGVLELVKRGLRRGWNAHEADIGIVGMEHDLDRMAHEIISDPGSAVRPIIQKRGKS